MTVDKKKKGKPVLCERYKDGQLMNEVILVSWGTKTNIMAEDISARNLRQDEVVRAMRSYDE